MITTILFALVLILSGMLGFLIWAMQYEHNRKMQEIQRRKDARWQTIFQRTDLKA